MPYVIHRYLTRETVNNSTKEERLLYAKLDLVNSLPIGVIPNMSTLRQIHSEEIIFRDGQWVEVIRSEVEVEDL